MELSSSLSASHRVWLCCRPPSVWAFRVVRAWAVPRLVVSLICLHPAVLAALLLLCFDSWGSPSLEWGGVMASLWAVIVLPTPSHFSFSHFHCACLSRSSLRVSLLSRDRAFTALVLAYTANVNRLTVSRVGFLVFVPCDCSRSRVVSFLIIVLVFA